MRDGHTAVNGRQPSWLPPVGHWYPHYSPGRNPRLVAPATGQQAPVVGSNGNKTNTNTNTSLSTGGLGALPPPPSLSLSPFSLWRLLFLSSLPLSPGSHSSCTLPPLLETPFSGVDFVRGPSSPFPGVHFFILKGRKHEGCGGFFRETLSPSFCSNSPILCFRASSFFFAEAPRISRTPIFPSSFSARSTNS